MSLRYLGEQIDIHGGGEDLIFPHHENEIAQTEAYTGKKPFARFWLHNAWVKAGDEKMSKSLGNFVTIGDALDALVADAHPPLGADVALPHPLTFTEDALDAAKRGVERLRVGRARVGAMAPATTSTRRLPRAASSRRWTTT